LQHQNIAMVITQEPRSCSQKDV